jgi:proteasome lid subunit RPN8/RPN11
VGNGPLSGDEITFGEMSVREPERRQRPDRDRRFACLAYEVPGLADLPIFLDRRAADAIERHALSDTSVELGGILLGKECLDQQTGQPFVWVSHSVEAKHYANTQASFTYTHDSWEEITRQRDQKFPEFDIVGWYHTHPSFGIFLSHHDLFIQQHFFSQPLQVAYVVDPINQTRGFFQWRDGGMAQVAGYYLASDRGDRVALARLVNDLEQLPNSETASGGTFSPRLEAELINMLSRPAIHRDTTTSIEKAQIAAVFGLLGVFLGMLMLAVAFGLYQLNGRIQDQSDTLTALSRLVEKSADGQRLTRDMLEEKIAGEKPASFEDRISKAYKARDDAEHQLGIQRSMNETLTERDRDLRTLAANLADQLEGTKKKLERAEKDAKEAPTLREANEKLQASNERQQKELDEIKPFLEKDEGKKISATLAELERMRYAALSGWAVSALLCAGLVALYFYFKPLADDGALDHDAPQTEDRPTHRIE